MLFLSIITYIKINPLYLIKFFSCIFDFILAIYSSKIIYLITKNKNKSYFCYLCIIINSSIWGQCDTIYTSFLIISIYYLLKTKYIYSFIFYGIAFSFKLQAIFLLPLFIILFFTTNKIKLYHFLIIPLVNGIMCLPAIILGRNILEVMLIYFTQTKSKMNITMNFPNIYYFFLNNTFIKKYLLAFKIIGTLFTILIIIIY